VWSDVLKIEEIDATKNFFDLGGDSLKAIEMISRLQALLHVEVPLIAFFEDPTIAHLAAVADELLPHNGSSDPAVSKTQAAVATVWSDVLQLGEGEIDATNNFFDLGGDSLKAIEVISRLQAVLHVELPLIAFFEDPTIAHLAAVADEMLRESGIAGPSAASATAASGKLETAPLSFAQLMYWLLQQIDPLGHLYHQTRVVRIRGAFRADILQRAVDEICGRHEVLRTRIEPGADEPIQVIDPNGRVAVLIEDLSAVAADAREDAAMAAALSESQLPFDLASDLPMRVRLLRLGHDDHLLSVVMHHVVADGQTGSIFFDELSALYGAMLAGKPSGLPELAFQYPEYAAGQREQMQGARRDKETEYWGSQLAGAPPHLDLPTDKPRPERAGNDGDLCGVMVPPATLQRLKALSQATGSTLFAVLMSALRIVLYRWASGQAGSTAQQDMVIGTVASNRTRAGSDKVIGCFLNFLPLRNSVSADEPAAGVLNREKQIVRDAFAHGDLPFVKIAAAAGSSRISDANPLYNVVLLLQNYAETNFTGESFTGRFVDLKSDTALLDLRFLAEERAGGLQLDCEFKTELFDRASVQSLLEGFAGVLETLADDPARLVSDFVLPQAMMTQAEATRRREQKQTVAITSTFTAEPLEAPLAFWMKELGIRSEVSFAPYSQVFQQLLDPASQVLRNRDGFNIVLLRLTDWQRFEENASAAEAREKIERSVRELAGTLKAVAPGLSAPMLVCLCPAERKFAADQEWAEFLIGMEQMLASELSAISGVHVITPAQIADFYPVEDYEDPYADKLGHIPYTPAFFTALGSMLARRIFSLRSGPRKVIVLDCDNTLWKGVCGEEGPSGVVVDTPRRALQEFTLRQIESGMLICLCSKNAEEDVDAVFAQNAGMVLRDKDIAARRVNWNPKSQNLRELAAELQLGLDSFVFVDDNPIECAEVEAQCPEVLTLLLPQNDEQIPGFLKNVWALDHWKITSEDARRTEMYRQNAEREQIRKQASTLDDFLAGLELKLDIHPMREVDLARVSQLTDRTNQFNFTTIRRNEAELQQFLESGGQCLVVNLSDRFGDYGLVGVILYSLKESVLEIDTLLLSCRALGRKVEHNMLSRLGEIAAEKDLPRVVTKFVATRKNQPALDFLNSVGAQFQQEADGHSEYQFPAEYATEVRRQQLTVAAPESSEEAGTAKTAREGTSGLQIAGQNRLLARIATQLGDVGSISRAVEVERLSRRQQRGVFVAPRNAVEEMVAGAWAQLLNLDQIGIHDNFFALGGHSLLATQAVARVRQTLGVELPLRAMFEAATVAEFAQRVEDARRTGGGLQAPPITKSPRSDSMPISFAQQRLWFLDQLEPGDPLYNIPQMFRMRGKLDVNALHRALNKVVERHESLRTTFGSRNSEPMQVIAPRLEMPLPVTDLRRLPEPSREAEVEKLATAEARKAFDLAVGPLVRAQLLRLSDEDHILLFTMHHIVSDRWSMGVVSEELAAHYAAFVSGKPSTVPDLRIQYPDFAAWQRRWMQGEALSSQLTYWKQQLAGAPRVLELPTDRTRPPVLSAAGDTTSVILPRALLEKLTALSRTEGATLFMTLLAAFQTLLTRYSGQEDVVVGSPIANRQFAELEPLIGFFVNTLALRGDLSGDPSFRSLLARTKKVCLNAYAHQDFPFEKLVEELQPERSLSHSPVFQVLFALQNAPMQSLELPGVKMERVPLYTGTSMFDMSWFAIEVPEGLLVRAEYSTDLFEKQTIVRALGHFRKLLESAVAQPESRISDLVLLTAPEREQIVGEWNRTEVEYPRTRSLQQFIEEQVEKTPDAPALVFESQELSYRELNSRANQLAYRLRKLGVGRDVLVGICAERSLEMVLGLLGIMKAGGAYVPLDPDYPSDRLAAVIEDAAPPVLLTQEHLLGILPPHDAPVICLDRDWGMMRDEPVTNPDCVTSGKGKDLAYAIFTSGSTGKPKGVPNVHEGIVNRLLWMQHAYGLDGSDRILQKTPYSFDVSVWEFFWPLMTGACLVMARPEGHKDPSYLCDLIQRQKITTLHFVPSMLRIFLEAEGVEACSSLRRVICSGEALPLEVQDRFFERLQAELHNLYGPTEAAVDVTYWACIPNYSRSIVPIGRPIWNTQIYILDPRLQPVPVGVPGELHIGGVGLARGYLNRPQLTAEKFIRDPFRAQAGARLYKTGDLCRFLPDGNIEYLGRIDHQVKIRGFRIELGEIESTLDRYAGVRQSVVMAREDIPGDKRLVAYIVPAAGEQPDADNLREHLKQSLPEFMVPSAFVFLEQFPLSSNGKIDRKVLPAPEYKSQGHSYVAPRGATEEHVAAIWQKVLRIPQAGANDNFFTLGGHSLLATQVISRIRQEMRVELPLRTMFEIPTLAELARRVDALRAASQSRVGAGTGILRAVSRNQELPLSFAQQRLWFLNELEPNSPAFNIAHTLKISGAVDAAAMEKSFNRMATRHETLRTSFGSQADEPVQIIHAHDSVRVPFRKIDLSGIDKGTREAEAQRLIVEDANRPFDLTHAPLIRALLLRLSEDEHYLLISIHHIISDRWSVSILVSELARQYEAAAAARDAAIPELPLQYADYAVWQRKWLSGDVLEQQLGYWKEKLKNAPQVLELPTDRPRQASESFRGEVVQAVLPRELKDKLNQLSREQGATLFMTLLAGFEALLSRYSGQRDLVVGTAIANREQPELENVIGLFLNTLPLRADLMGDPSFSEILTRAKETALGAYEHQDMPFEKLVEELRPERSLRHSPLIQVYFVLQNAPVESVPLQSLRWKHVPSGLKTVKGDMYLSMHESAEGIEGRLEYSTDLFDAATMERFLGHFQVLLEAAVANPALKLSQLPLLTEAERQLILVDWNATESAYPRDLILPQLFEQQAARTPEAVACILPGETAALDQQLTYRELNQRSNQLAHFLRKRGACPGQRIGIFVERSLDMMVGLLGIQKSGAAYVPLDPGYPPERIRLALEDAQAPLLITQQSLVAALPETGAGVVCLDRDWPEITKQSAANPVPTATSDDLLYVIFTSGSTGRPKGVQVPHRAVLNLLAFMGGLLRAGTGDVFPALASMAFDMCIPELYLALISGGRVVVVPREVSADGEALAGLLRRTGATVVHATPTTWNLLLEAGFSGKGLERVIGAEPVPPELSRRLLEADPSLYNFYGPTETTVWSTYHHFVSPSEPVVIGKPLANTQVYVLDKNQQPVPVGVEGEIYIGGDGVTDGYLNRPELTAEKFVPNPFATEQSLETGETNGLLAHELFALQSIRVSNRVAAVFGKQTVTYGDLNARSNQLARYLRALGVVPDVLVGLCLDRSLDMLIALLATHKAGGAYVPLDPTHPKERIGFILGDARPAVLLTQKSLRESLPETSAQVVCVDADWQMIAVESPEPLTPYEFPTHLAYVLYTSGSTGKPKGVQIEHGNLLNLLLSMRKLPGLRSTDRMLATTTLSFDIAQLEIYLPLITGAQVVLASREEAADGQRLLALMAQAKPTVMQATPATWRMLVEAGWSGSPKLKVLCGGEALPADLAQQLLPRCRELWNMYGPTETTIWSSLYRVRAGLNGAVPIGRPVANTSMYVLDENFLPLPVGVTGELYIGGDGLARGYHNRAELTSEKFVHDPFGHKPGARLYRTGDLAKYLPDGNIQYLGRTDFQVKVRGFRIELGEIESALVQHPAVRQAVVSAREDAPGDKRLVAYVVPKPGSHLNITEARTYLKQSLPDYMLPSALVELDALPLTPNGKVDRKALPKPESRSSEAQEYLAPRTPEEEVVAGIWSEVLKLQQVGIHDDFFALGGHSLLATQVTSRIRQAFKMELPLRALFEAPTVAGLAARIATLAKKQAGIEAAPPMRRASREKPIPLSFSQQRLWFLDQLEPGNPLYNVAYVTRMSGPVNAQALEDGLNEIVRRHESLRTTFQSLNDQPVQVIAPKLQVTLRALDASHLPALAERETETRRLATIAMQQPFDLAAGPLLRPVLIKIGDDDHALVLNTHHIISDRWSMGVLTQELAALYEANLQGKSSPLPELEIQYADYAVWQREFLSADVLDKQIAYWRQKLEGAPPVLELPADRARKGTEQFWGAQHRQPIPKELATAVRALSRAQRGTFYMALLAGFHLLMSRLAGQDDVVLGTDLANRTQVETEKLIGFFVNLLPIRARVNLESSFADFFQQVRETSLETMAHQDVPFDKLVEELRPERSLTHNPLVQVLFVMQNTPQMVMEFGGLKLRPLGVGGASRFDLVMFINNPETDASTIWSYNPNLFDASTIARMANSYEMLLKTVCADPEIKLGAVFAALDQADKQQRGSEHKTFQEAGLAKLKKTRRKVIAEV
jgi:amino acid adenylation domain-containing protein/FkbH-like protein